MSSTSAETPCHAESLFGEYRGVPNLYDELRSSEGRFRPHWQKLGTTLAALGVEEMSLRAETARRVIREHGITYNVYSDPQGMDRLWELDLLPQVISGEEWRALERGLIQRATLLNCVLQDIFGPQDLLRTGAIPPALAYGNPDFLRPCHGIKVPRGIHLHLHAVDMARSPKGEWWVLADRTQAPSGSGYALENRIVTARVLPDEYKEMQVHRLAPFFSAQREMLRSLAPEGVENPHVVLLTPGPHNETYFEHAYLARYLGFTLVEGGDLTVRDSCVFLKTLEGLQRVDVILRRVDDTFCDPLELRGDSFLGVAGLVQSARKGNVTVANALGSSLVESPAFLAFLPSLCKLLLGQDLLLPSVATWWCGQAKEQRYVLEHLDEIVIKPAFGRVSKLPFFGSQAAPKTREKLIAGIEREPFAFVGQEQVSFSTAPAWIQDHFEPRGVAIRFYTAASGNSYSVMPGGLTRVSSHIGDPVASMQSGGGSKDTWVLSDTPVAPVSLLTATGQPASTNRVAAELPSRVADNLFWLGRYSERLETTLRLLRCVLGRLTDESTPEAIAELNALAEVFALTERLPRQGKNRITAKEFEQEILLLVYNPQRMGSVRELVLRLRHIASMVRDRLSVDTWRILNQLQLDSKTRAGRLPLGNALSVCHTLITDLAAFSGMEMENMVRGHSWRFLDFGRRLERAYNLADLVRAALLVNPPANPFPALLEFADSTITYRRRYFSEPRRDSVLELLLNDDGNPRSLAFQLNALKDHARHFPKSQTSTSTAALHLRITRLAEKPSAILETMAEGVRGSAAKEMLLAVASELTALSDDVTEQYFCHTISQRVEASP